jgi:hypothetical protein
MYKHTNTNSMEITTRFDIIAYLYYLALFLTPIIQAYISVYVQVFLVTFCLIDILIKLSTGRFVFFSYPIFLYLLLQLISGLLSESTGAYQFILNNYSLVVLYFHVFFAYFILVTNNKKAINLIIVTSLVLVTITCVTSIIGLQKVPMAARLIATPSTSQADLLSFRRLNIGGFRFVYTCVLLVPLIIASYKNRKLKLWTFILLIVPISYYVLKTQYALALITLLLGFTSFFLPRRLNIKKTAMFFIGIAITFFLIRPLVAQALYFMANNVNSYMLQVKISSAADLIAAKDNNTASLMARQMAYEESINLFLDNPITGTFFDSEKIGGHSFVFDTLARFGVFGLLLLILIYGNIYRYFFLPFRDTPYFGYMIMTFALNLFLSFLNPIENIFIIGLFAPFFVYRLLDAEYVIVDGKGKLIYNNEETNNNAERKMPHNEKNSYFPS